MTFAPSSTAARSSARSRSCPWPAALPAWAHRRRRRPGWSRRASACSRRRRRRGRSTSTRGSCGADITEGRPGRAAAAHAAGGRRRLPAGRGRAGRRLALRRAPATTRARRQGSDRRATPAARPSCAARSSTGARGVARFDTIWPGWYRGRTPHIHYKVLPRRPTRADQPALLPRRRQRGGLRPRRALRGRAGAGHRQRQPTASPGAPATRAFAEVTAGRRRLAARLVAGIDPGA